MYDIDATLLRFHSVRAKPRLGHPAEPTSTLGRYPPPSQLIAAFLSISKLTCQQSEKPPTLTRLLGLVLLRMVLFAVLFVAPCLT